MKGLEVMRDECASAISQVRLSGTTFFVSEELQAEREDTIKLYMMVVNLDTGELCFRFTTATLSLQAKHDGNNITDLYKRTGIDTWEEVTTGGETIYKYHTDGGSVEVKTDMDNNVLQENLVVNGYRYVVIPQEFKELVELLRPNLRMVVKKWPVLYAQKPYGKLIEFYIDNDQVAQDIIMESQQ